MIIYTQAILPHAKYLILTQTTQKAQNVHDAVLVLAATPPTRMSVGCDEGNFSFPEECCLLLISAGWYTQAIARVLAFPFGRRTRFQTKCGVLINRSLSLLATLVTPPPCGHPLYKQRGSLLSRCNKHVKNNPYIKPCYLTLPPVIPLYLWLAAAVYIAAAIDIGVDGLGGIAVDVTTTVDCGVDVQAV